MTDSSRVRVSIVGVVVVALFSTLLARLWFLQSGAETSLKVQAAVAATRVIQTESPRGEILDRNGAVLVRDRPSWAVTVDRDLPARTSTRVIGQLAELLAIPAATLNSQYHSQRQSQLEPAVVALDVPQPDRLAILQDPQDYPGVHVKRLTVREYPRGDLAAQLLGYVGEVPEADMKRLQERGYEPGDSIGLSGAESVFESVLRGRPRRETVEVNPAGHQVGPPIDIQPGSVGDNVHLTIDYKVQRAAERALAQGILDARTLQNDNLKDVGYFTLQAPAGAAVVLDATNGEVVAAASYPTYSPDWWVGGISDDNYKKLTGEGSNYPLLDRATQGTYAPGSTFKLVTSLAMAKNGIQDPNQYIDDNGVVRIQGTDFHNVGDEVLGPVNLQSALTKSSDVYFYNVGYDFWRVWKGGDTKRGLGIQSEARELGFGAPTGFELDESDGRVPDPDWKEAFAHQLYDDKEKQKDNSIWYPYDNLSIAVGQGDLIVTPLQLANVYASFANDGTLWRPHIEQQVTDAAGKVLKTTPQSAIRHIPFDPALRGQILAGFEGVVGDPEGTAYEAFQGFPLDRVPIVGKTGTAEVKNKGDTSLFAATWPATAPKYVIVVVVEQGGLGAQTAAPIARNIIETMNGGHPGPVQVIRQGHD